MLIEIEAVLNSRPMIYIYDDDIEELLTPSHLFFGRQLMDLPDAAQDDYNDDINRNQAVNKMKRIAEIVDHFWKRWHKEYLLELREHHKMKKQQGKTVKINPGEVVCIQEDNVKRQRWRIGRVEEVIQGRDGVARAAIFKVSTEGRISRISRPLPLLYSLEVKDHGAPQEEIQEDQHGKEQQDTSYQNDVKQVLAQDPENQ